MNSATNAFRRHLVAVPSPGRGHINSILNTCKLLASKSDNILITLVLTEEWLGLLSSEQNHDKIRFATIPNVVPSEHVRAMDMSSFATAVWTKMEEPFEKLLDDLDPPASLIIADTFLNWAVPVGNRRNIPVISYWPMSATMLDKHPSSSPVKFNFSGEIMSEGFMKCFSSLAKADYLLISSIYELESRSIDALRAKFSFPVYVVGPAIPYFELYNHTNTSLEEWLDKQPRKSVLYVSMGSFLSVSDVQMDEIAAGLNNSRVRFLWVARGDTARLKEEEPCMGMVVPWCDQLRVLSHPSIGGFLSHCGWNSVQEGLFSGIPFLTFPIIADQEVNSWLITEEWKIGWRMKKSGNEAESLVSREEIAQLVQNFMDLQNSYEMRKRAEAMKELCIHAVAEDGSSGINITSFINNI